MDIDFLTHIIVEPLGPNMQIIFPSPSALRELEEVVSECLIALDFERPWQAVDDFAPAESGSLRIAD